MIRTITMVVLAVILIAVSHSTNAEQVQSATSTYLSFRHCIAGETVCDSFGRTEMSAVGGQRGELTALADLADPAFGEARGNVQATGLAGAAAFNTSVTSVPAVRNGTTNIFIQRYTNAGANAESLNLNASLSYSQTVPAENANFPDDGGTYSGSFVEMLIFKMDDEFFEVGTTANENFAALMGDGDDPTGFEELATARLGSDSNATEQGTKQHSISTDLLPGESVWCFAVLQSFAVNGAVVNASMTTELSATQL